MPSDPTALSDMSGELPQDADPRPEQVRDLLDIAAALERIESEMTERAASTFDGFAALENIQDIAFALHERSVDPSLCDALDAALREMSDAVARAEHAAARDREVAQMLGALSRRVAAMIAPTTADRGAELPAADMAASARDDAIDFAALLGTPLFALDAEQTEHLAQAVASLVSSLPASADVSRPALELRVANDERPKAAEPAAAEPASNETLAGNAAVRNDPPSQEISDVRPASDMPPSEEPSRNQAIVAETTTQHAAGARSLREISILPAADSLGAMRALSEEELIALFS